MRVEVITSQEAKPWILGKHYAKRMPCITHCYGAFVNGSMVGVCSFGMPASYTLCEGVCGEEYKDKVLELNRLVVDDKSDIKRSAFVATCLKRLGQLFTTGKATPNGRVIVSYADTSKGHIGKIYQATNWIYTGMSAKRTDPSGDAHQRHLPTDGSITERTERSPKHRYVYFVGHRSWKRKAQQALRYPVLPYPEGKTQRYDASAPIQSQSLLF